MTTELSNRLRNICDKHDVIGNIPMIITDDLRRYADLIDQQAAEIADLKLRLNRWNSGDNSIGAKEQVKRLMRERDIALIEMTRYARAIGKIEAERDEWRRRAAVLRLHVPEQIWSLFVREFPEAAQWFEEN